MISHERDVGFGFDVRSLVLVVEWECWVVFAVVYWLVVMFGWDDLVFTYISVWVLDLDGVFLINFYGMLFEEITVFLLVKIDP